jgi:aminomethyltransferase
MANDETLRRSPLNEIHVEAGARLVPFAGWTMPVQYAGVIEEHRAVRERAGLFDVSHMGELRVRGAGAEGFLQRVTPNDVSKLTPGRAHYSGLLTEQGTYVDDLLVYRLAEEDFLVVVNAANTEKDLAWLAERQVEGATVEDESDRWALLALQGPRAEAILSRLTELDLAAIRYYRFAEGEVAGRSMIVSRTGYTGEDGFELYVPPEAAPDLWRSLMAAGADQGLQPAGLGARDTLRMEAGMALYGHEIDDTTTPLEAGLRWVVKMDKGDFVGRAALERQEQAGLERRLVGIEVAERGIARQGYPVWSGERRVGEMTSGTWSPTFEKALGMAYVPVELAEPGTPVDIEIRQRRVGARVAEIPFYRRSK